jgi:hypothetical protein
MDQFERMQALAERNPWAFLLVGCVMAIVTLWRAERRSFQLLTSMTVAMSEMGKAVSVGAIIAEEQMDFLNERAPKRASRVRAKVAAILKGNRHEPGSTVPVEPKEGAAPGGAGGADASAGAAPLVPGKAGAAG